MNEKLKELAEQASKYASRETTDLDEWEFIFRTKFAEGIVSECAEKIAHNEKFNWLDAAQAAKDLKTHFGVKNG